MTAPSDRFTPATKPSYSGLSSPNGCCPHCGGKILGDGCTTVRHCENADLDDTARFPYGQPEPDANPVYCLPQTA